MGLLDDLGAFANPFGTPAKGGWNIVAGTVTDKVTSQTTVFFTEEKSADKPQQLTGLENTSDTGGRRLAIYEYPYLDGQMVRDLGRKGQKHTFNIKFFGQNYQEKFQDFFNKIVKSNNALSLSHPTLSPLFGNLTVRFSEYEFVHKFDEWNAVTIKATFVEDNTDEITAVNSVQASQDSALRSALQNLVNAQASIGSLIFSVGALLLLPNAILNGMKQRLDSIAGEISRLLGQLGSTFSSNATLQGLAAQAAPLIGGFTDLSSGTAVTSIVSTQGQTQSAQQLPPVYQVGFDAQTQASINSQVASFVSASQITTQQAVFSTNQIRQAITAAINEAQKNLSNDGSDIVLQYRSLSVSLQQAVESCIAATQALIKVYITPSAMSVRQIAFKNGLSTDRQNDIEALNPYLSSVNFVPANTRVIVPAV